MLRTLGLFTGQTVSVFEQSQRLSDAFEEILGDPPPQEKLHPSIWISLLSCAKDLTDPVCR